MKCDGGLEKESQATQDGILLTEANLTKRKDKRNEEKVSALKMSLAEKQNDIVQFQQKMSPLPDKVFNVEVLEGKPMFPLRSREKEAV